MTNEARRSASRLLDAVRGRPDGRRGPDPATSVALVILAAVTYVPLLLTAPGRVVDEGDPSLFLAPSRLLRRAASAWDPHEGLGAVSDLELGLLWPLGPYHWLADRLGVPDWVAHRLWLGSILFAAGGGVLFLARTWRWRPEGGAAAAFVYALSPHIVLSATGDTSVLLAFAGLPWLLALTIRALRTPGWRHPALFALVVATVGSTNPAALLLVLLAPAGWIVHALWRSPEVTRSGAAWTAAKLVVVSTAVNLWWLVGFTVQVTNGLSTRPYEETPQTVASASTAPEVLRGLGDSTFYGRDHLGPIVGPAERYTQSPWLLGLTLAVVCAGLLGLGVSRWRNRVFTIGVLVAGTVVAVGANPRSSPSPIGAVFEAAVDAEFPLAIRDPARAVPLVVLAIALGVGALVGASLEQSRRRGIAAACITACVAFAALPPLWLGELVPDGRDRPEDVPEHWNEVAAHLDAQGDGTRVLELPGLGVTAHDWGVAGSSVSAALGDRPHATRRTLPTGTAASADLIRALDARLHDRTLSADALASIARLLNAGDVVTRHDIVHQRDGTIRPDALWQLALESDGLGTPATYGPAVDDGPLSIVDSGAPESAEGQEGVPSAAVFPVVDAVPIVHAHAAGQQVLLSGDGTGIVDAATAGLLSGDELIRYSADLTADPTFVRSGLVDDRVLIVTDTNRERAERWDGIHDVFGFTELAEGGVLHDDPADRRLPLFDDRPATAAVAEHVGLAARATSYGPTGRYEPSRRPVRAVDGDPTTAWTVDVDDPSGERLELTSDEAIDTAAVSFLQPSDAGRWITEVDLRFDGGDATRVVLDERSRSGSGQVVRVEQRAFEQLSIEIVAVGGTAGREVGLAEVGLGVSPTREYVRMPEDLLDAGGFRTLRFPLALVQTRQRTAAVGPEHADEELDLARVVDLPTARSYRLTGSARLSTTASPVLLDTITGRTGDVAVTTSSSIAGGIAHAPSNVLDTDPDTRWTSAAGATTPHRITLTSTTPRPIGSILLAFVDDDRHSVPTEVTISVDGATVGRTTIPAGDSGVRSVDLELDETVTGSVVTLTYTAIDQRTATSTTGDEIALPVSITDLTLDGWSVSARSEVFDSGCRDDLVLVDGVGVPVRVSGPMDAALRGEALTLRSCDDDPITIPGGDRTFDSADGRVTGIDVDQLVWCSAGGGGGCDTAATDVVGAGDDAPTIEVLDSDDTTIRVQVSGAEPGTPFWLVLGQSFEPGWQITESGAGTENEPAALVDGYANGFLVDPGEADFEVTLRFVPQNRVEIGLLLSVVGVVLALGLAIGSPAPRQPVPIPLQEPLRRIRALTWEGGLPTRRDALAVALGAGLFGTLVAGPVVGVLLAVLAGAATRQEGWRSLFTVVPSGLLVVTAVYVVSHQVRHHFGHGPGWPEATGRLHTVALVAVVLLIVDLVIDRMWERRSDFR